jgi:hypothetical protein
MPRPAAAQQASVGLSVLDLLARGALATGDWKTQQLAILQQAEKPKAQLLLVTVPAVQRLVEAAASGGGCSTAKWGRVGVWLLVFLQCRGLPLTE